MIINFSQTSLKIKGIPFIDINISHWEWKKDEYQNFVPFSGLSGFLSLRDGPISIKILINLIKIIIQILYLIYWCLSIAWHLDFLP